METLIVRCKYEQKVLVSGPSKMGLFVKILNLVLWIGTISRKHFLRKKIEYCVSAATSICLILAFDTVPCFR